jgi:spore germination cell wall hydrolase CwlJ-like protein
MNTQRFCAWLIYIFIFLFSLHMLYKHNSHKTFPLVSSAPITTMSMSPIVIPDKPSLCAAQHKCTLLAEAIVYEARGEPTEGQIAVAHTIINRKNDTRWPDTIRDVVLQPAQFSFVADKHKQAQPTMSDWDKALRIAYNALYEPHRHTRRVTNATHFHTIYTRPKWSKRLERVAVIGQHVFYK